MMHTSECTADDYFRALVLVEKKLASPDSLVAQPSDLGTSVVLNAALVHLLSLVISAAVEPNELVIERLAFAVLASERQGK